MVSSDLVFTLAVVAFLIVLAVVVFRLVWLRRAATESYLQSHNPQPPRAELPEWGRIVRREKDLLP